jgi:uncharacterized protein YndB with AHSA1/START domain
VPSEPTSGSKLSFPTISTFVAAPVSSRAGYAVAAPTRRAILARWYAPPGCRIEFRHLDVRPGGTFRSCIRTPDGHACWCKGVYREVVPPERIVSTMVIADEHGNTLDPITAGMDPDWPVETILTVTFTESDGRTTLTLRQTFDETVAKRTEAHPSWLLMLERLAGLVVQT